MSKYIKLNQDLSQFRKIGADKHIKDWKSAVEMESDTKFQRKRNIFNIFKSLKLWQISAII